MPRGHESSTEGGPGASTARAARFVSKATHTGHWRLCWCLPPAATSRRLRYGCGPFGAVAQAPQARAAPRAVAVEVATAVKKSTPVQIEALGTVTPMASVAIKSRIDSEITGMHFADGARVKQGDLLITLDGRAIEAQILQAEGNIARDKAQLEGAERDIAPLHRAGGEERDADHQSRQCQDPGRGLRGGAEGRRSDPEESAGAAQLCARSARRSPGASAPPSVKVGNFVRSADLLPIATIIQTAPVYVSFPMPQMHAARAARGDRRRRRPASRRSFRARRSAPSAASR